MNKSKHVYEFQDNITTITIELVNPIRNNTTIKNITIPNNITDIEEYAFDCCKSITSINIPNSVKKIGQHAFDCCSSLRSINIPNSVTSIERETFGECIGLTAVNIPNSVTYIGKAAFYKCTGLRSINIPNSVTNIEENTFFGCKGLTSITIPNGVTNIEQDAFKGCKGLLDIIIPESLENKDLDFWTKIGIDLDKTELVTESTLSTWASANTLPSAYSYHELSILYILQKDNNFTPSWFEINQLVPNVVISDLLKIIPIGKKSTVLPKPLKKLTAKKGLLGLSFFSFAPGAHREVQGNHNHKLEVVNEYVKSHEPEKTLRLKDMSYGDDIALLKWLTLKEVAILLIAKATSDIKPMMKDETELESEFGQKVII